MEHVIYGFYIQVGVCARCGLRVRFEREPGGEWFPVGLAPTDEQRESTEVFPRQRELSFFGELQ